MTGRYMKRCFLGAALGVAVMVSAGAERAGAVEKSATGITENSLVGVWYVKAIGAPFEAHLFTFHSDGTMVASNPDAGDRRTSDSNGMGPWKRIDGNSYIGKFAEINADRATGAFHSSLIVTFKIKVTGSTFTGQAEANYSNPDGSHMEGPLPATLEGTRISLP